jgi:hypothetical protein
MIAVARCLIPSSLILLAATTVYASGMVAANQLRTRTQMAFWLTPGERSAGQLAHNTNTFLFVVDPELPPNA